jgi:hypothetical protein
MATDPPPGGFLYWQDEPPTTFHKWDALPTELRDLVMVRHLAGLPCSYAGVIDEHQHSINFENILLPLLKTQKKIATSAREAYYGNNTFRLYCGVDEDTREPLYGLARPRVEDAKYVKHLKVLGFDCYIGHTLEDMLLDPNAGWRWILKPTRPLSNQAPKESQWGDMPQPNSDQNTAWQRSFTNLHSLTIEFLQVDETPGKDVELYYSVDDYCCLTPARMTQLENWIGETEILLRAKDVEIVLEKWCSRRFDVSHEERIRVPWLENMVKS